eukprot:1161773-Pelagomonas_calceolata.AAC.27
MVQKPDAAVPAPSLRQGWCRSPMQQCLHQACDKDGVEARCSNACAKDVSSLVQKTDAADSHFAQELRVESCLRCS